MWRRVTRRTQLSGATLMLALLFVGGWCVLGGSALSGRLRRHLPRGLRQYFAVKPLHSPRMAKLPNLYLWAWERPENLEFLGDSKVGVAFLAKTISPMAPKASPENSSDEKEDAIFIRPRLQPLRIVPGTPLMAVVRIESAQGLVPSNYSANEKASSPISNGQIALMAGAIVDTTNIPGVLAVQIDFDATASEHNLYRALLIEVRKRLPAEIPLSITALASWCIGDRWLEQLPPGTIDEAVPMLFRMGVGEREIVNYVSSGEEFSVAACNGSIGVSTDETFSRDILSGKIVTGWRGRESERIYVFSPKAWEQANAETTLEAIQKWRAN